MIEVKRITMRKSCLQVSRWVLAPELLFCFVNLSLAWFDHTFGSSGLLRIDMNTMQHNFLEVPGGTVYLIHMIAESTLGILGPLGLVVSFRLVFLNRHLCNKLLAIILICGPLVLGAIFIVGWLLTATEIHFHKVAYVFAISILPALGAAHMYYYSQDQCRSFASEPPRNDHKIIGAG